jgi:hypothetical protein
MEDFQNRSSIKPIEGEDYEEFAKQLEKKNYADQVDDHIDEEENAAFRAKVDNIRKGIMELNKSKPTHVDAKNEKKAQMVKLLQQLSKTDVARIQLVMANEKKAGSSDLQKDQVARASRAEQRKRSQALKAGFQGHGARSGEALARLYGHQTHAKQERLAKEKRKIVMQAIKMRQLKRQEQTEHFGAHIIQQSYWEIGLMNQFMH